MKVLVTGASGFVGSHVVDHLLEKGYDVRCIIRSSSNLKWLTSPKIELFSSTLFDEKRLELALDGVDAIYHIAGSLVEKDWHGFYNANVTPVENLLKISKNSTSLKKFILVSSTGAAGPSEHGKLLSEEDPPNPVSAYGRSKLEGEYVAKKYMDTLPITIVRPSAVYGPRDNNILKIFKDVQRGITPLLGSDEQFVNLVHAEDLAKGIVLAGESSISAGETFTITSLRPYSRTELLDTIGDIVGKRSKRPVLPKRPIVFALKTYSAIMTEVFKRKTLLDQERIETIAQQYWVFDVSKAVKLLHYNPFYDLKSGMQQTYNWYLREGWLKNV